jgi:uncharacterized sulfatase
MLLRLSVMAAVPLAGSMFLLTVSDAAAEKRPDFVVFLSDDHGQRDSTPYGATDVRTPNLQRLADEGMVFTHAFVASPSCAPSRAALLTGLMSARNGAQANHTFKRDGILSLPEVLRGLGYETAAFGKVAHGTKDVERHGFDVIDKSPDTLVVAAFLEKRDRNKPLCLFVGCHEPHVPWPEAEGYQPGDVVLPDTFVDTPETRAYRTRYLTAVTIADRRLGELTDLVARHLSPGNTLLLYSSDHGAQWPFGKWNLYDAGIRVPLIVRWPGRVAPGNRTAAMVQWTDILPTLIDAAGGKPPADLDGRSFLPVLLDGAREHRDRIFTTHTGDGVMNVYPMRSVRTKDMKLILNPHPEFAYTTHIDKALARDGGLYWSGWWELAKTQERARDIVHRYHERPEWELYDLAQDPLEIHNLADDPDHAAQGNALKAELRQWMTSQGDTAEPQPDKPPRLLSDPASTTPGPDAMKDEPAPRPVRKPTPAPSS